MPIDNEELIMTDAEETENEDTVDATYAPNNEFHLHLSVPQLPDGVRRLVNAIANRLASFIEKSKIRVDEGELDNEKFE